MDKLCRNSFLLFIFTIIIALVSCEEKSLFDDLPLNGAFGPGVSALNIKQLKSSLASVDIKHAVRNSQEKIPSQGNSYSDVASNENSLFNKLPNNGAMASDLKATSSVSSTQKRSFLNSDTGSSRNYQNGFFDSQKQAFPIEYKVHTADGVVPVISSSGGIRMPLLVTKRQNVGKDNIYDASPSPGNEKIVIPIRSHFTLPRHDESTTYVYGTPSISTPVQRSQAEEVHHYYPSKTKVRNYQHHHYNLPQIQPTYSSSIVYGARIREEQKPSQGYSYNPPTTTQAPFRPSTPQQFPIITGSTSPRPPPSNDGSADYDYESLEDIPHNFNSRTGSYKFSVGGGTGFSNEPSKYDSPPPLSHSSSGWNEPHKPQATYGPPIPEFTQPPSYGPPAEVHPPAPPPQPPQSPTSTTSISYQTIPIQTVHTQLVTVPHITVSSSSVVESEVSQDIPSQHPTRPISSGYGPPGYNVHDGSNRQVPLKKSGSLFTDDQIAALLAVSQHQQIGGSGLFQPEDDAYALLSGQVRGGYQDLGQLGQLSQPTQLDYGLQLQLQSNLPNQVFGRARPLGPIGPVHSLRQNFLRNNGLYNTRNLGGLLQQQRYAGSLGVNLPPQPFLDSRYANSAGGGGTVLTRDAIQTVNDLVQEQRLRGAVADLRTRLQYEGRSAARARENYRSLFYKGALLLSALTLIPTLASPIASAAVAQSAAAAASPLSYLLPLASGRKKRHIEFENNILKSLDDTSFKNCSRILKKSTFGNWLNCAENATIELFKHTNDTLHQSGYEDDSSMFDLMAFNGAYVPESIRASLLKYLPLDELKRNSECIQKRFCETVKQIESLPSAEAFLFIYSIFAGDLQSNPWIREAMTGGRNNNCGAFYCFEDYVKLA